MSSQSGFSSYAKPFPHLAFSLEDFTSLKISDVLDLSYPKIAEEGSVFSCKFSQETPTSGSATIVVPGEVLPHYADLLPVTREMEAQFKLGARSVVGGFTYMGNDYMFCYSFSKINLIRNVSNFQPAVRQYSHLINHLKGPQFELGDAFDTFCNSSFCDTINGLTMKFPLNNLACLLGETWLEDDVLNGLIELSYLQELVSAENTHDIAPIILPTTFLINARTAFYNTPTHIYTAEVNQLRKRLQISRPRVIAMALVSNNHFTSYIFRPGSSVIEYGDSLHQPPPSDMLEVLQWIFSGFAVLGISEIRRSLIISKQGAGSGSCGIAAHNFIERSIAPYTRSRKLKEWTPSEPHKFRDAALQDMVLYHHLAQPLQLEAHQVVANPWFINVLDSAPGAESNSQNANEILGLPGYDDYIGRVPSMYHPIHLFKKLRAGTMLQKQMYCEVQRVPMLHEISTVPLPVSLLPALQVNPPQYNSISAPVPKLEPSNASESESATPKKPNNLKKRQRHMSTEDLKRPSVTTLDGDNSDTPEIKPLLLLPGKMEDVDDDSPVVIDLCTPPRRNAKRFRYPSTPILIHSTPIKKEVEKEKHNTPLFIDLCTPEPKKSSKLEDNDKKPRIHVRNPVELAPGVAREGAVFDSLKEAQDAIYTREQRLGHSWRIGQSKVDGQGNKKKVTFRCNHYARPTAAHSVKIDPADHRNGKSIRTGCEARVNVNRVENTDLWRITLAIWKHNHPREIPEGGSVHHRPTNSQKEAISTLATTSTHKFSRGHITEMLKIQGDTTLEPRQISNLMNSARKEAREEIDCLGGDMNAIVANLQQRMQESHGWQYELKLDDNSVVTGLWWQSPGQAELGQRFSDVLINDNTYNCNRSNYPLNIGVVIDNHNSSRNIWYAFHAIEDEDHHNWVLQNHVKSAGYAPTVFASDRSKTLIASVQRSIPTSLHIFCINHLDGNVDKNLSRLVPSGEWLSFKNCFWEAYRAVSPDHFDEKWDTLTRRFPETKTYLDNELYTCREQWAWAWISHVFTCGVRTNGRVEVENRITKKSANPKTTLKQLFDILNARTEGQSAQSTVRTRDVSFVNHLF